MNTEYIYSSKPGANNKITTFTDAVKKAAEITHSVFGAKNKSLNARYAIESGDKEFMWKTLQEYFHEYKNFINSLSPLTGYYIYDVNTEFYNKLTVEEISNQLRQVIGFIYAKFALESVAKTTFKQALKSILKKSQIFTDTELSILF